MSPRRRSAVALAAALLAAAGARPAGAWEWPAWIDSVLFNAAERTDAGRRELAAGELDSALSSFESARRLAPDDPVASYNAGTARLAAGRSDAAPLLEGAAKGAAAELGSRASYNLGNARFGGDDFAGAVDAYRDALRAEPAFADAKHNLELALRRLEEQQQQQQSQQQDPQQQEQQQQQQQQQQQGEQKKDEQKKDEQKKDEPQGQQQEPPKDGAPPPPSPGQGEPPPPAPGPLPQFEDQPEMTAEEAAAILKAVENLERDQRRKEALEAMKKVAKGKKDW